MTRLAADGRTVLISSHVLSELEEVVDDTVFLVAGAVVDAPAVQARAWRIRILSAPPADAPEVGNGTEIGSDPRPPVAAALGVATDSLGIDRGDVLAVFGDDRDAAAGLARLIGSGVTVSAFAPARSELEQAFLSLGDAPQSGGSVR